MLALVPVHFLWTLDLRLWTWIWYLGLRLGLDNIKDLLKVLKGLNLGFRDVQVRMLISKLLNALLDLSEGQTAVLVGVAYLETLLDLESSRGSIQGSTYNIVSWLSIFIVSLYIRLHVCVCVCPSGHLVPGTNSEIEGLTLANSGTNF